MHNRRLSRNSSNERIQKIYHASKMRKKKKKAQRVEKNKGVATATAMATAAIGSLQQKAPGCYARVMVPQPKGLLLGFTIFNSVKITLQKYFRVLKI